MRTLLLAACLPLVPTYALAAKEEPPRPLAVVLDDDTPRTRTLARQGIASLGGEVLHAFDDLLVVTLPRGEEFRALRLPGIREVALNGLSLRAGPRGRGPSPGRAAWNAIVEADGGRSSPRPAEEPPHDDALTPPNTPLEDVRAISRLASTSSGGRRVALKPPDDPASMRAPYGATELNTSEFLAGSISVNIILVESDGTIEPQSESWSADRENEVVARIATGLEWVRIQEPRAALRFVYHVIPGRTDPRARTGYEPIRRAADPMGTGGEDLWAKAVLAKLGYGSGDRFARSRALASDTRRLDGSDWGVNVFVVDSLADPDGKFADGRYAYSWIGGPHLVMTYDNQAWGIGRMDMVLRHELMHAFFAFDEYTASACACAEHRGYLDGANTNCVPCNPAASSCVMIANGDAMCDATRRQLGWADLDGDGMLDVVGEDPDTFLDALPSESCGALALSGLASVIAATNRNPSPITPHTSISINRVAGVEVRADGAAWAPAGPEDGAWGAPQERFRAAFTALPPGAHRLEARARDDFGNVDGFPGAADVLVRTGAEPLGDSVRLSRSGGTGIAMTWDECGGATSYRVYRAASPSSSWTPVAQTTGTAWMQTDAPAGYYEVRPVDACGAEQGTR